jgi:hypothetical protein
VGGVGGGQDVRAGRLESLRTTVVDIGGGRQAQRRMPVRRVVPGKNTWQWARAAWVEANRAGKSGRYLKVLNRDSEEGLSQRT